MIYTGDWISKFHYKETSDVSSVDSVVKEDRKDITQQKDNKQSQFKRLRIEKRKSSFNGDTLNSDHLKLPSISTDPYTTTLKHSVKEKKEKARKFSGHTSLNSELDYCLNLCSTITDDLKRLFIHGNESLEVSNHVESRLRGGCTRVTHISEHTLNSIKEEIRALGQKQTYTLMNFQYVGVLWLFALYEKNLSGLLADDMGLGKTAQTCVFLRLAYISRNLFDLPCLILCTPTLVENWAIELGSWAPELRVLKYCGNQKERRCASNVFERSADTPDSIHVVIASIHSISNSWDRSIFLKRHKFEYMIVDEAHHLKNDANQIYKKMKRSISYRYCLLLTGSPVQNQVNELKNLLSLLFPKTLSCDILARAMIAYRKRESTLNKACSLTAISGDESLIRDEKTQLHQPKTSTLDTVFSEIQFLQTFVSPFILRRLKSDVVHNLPPKTYYLELCPLTGRQRQMYLDEIIQAGTFMGKQLCELFGHQCDETTNPLNANFSEKALQHLKKEKQLKNLFFRLRRICHHPLLYHGYYSSGTISRVAEFYAKLNATYSHEVSFASVHDLVSTWSDYDIHQMACEYETLNDLKIDPQEFLQSAKIRRMLALLEPTLQEEQKALVFSYFTEFLDIIETTLSLHRPSWEYLRLDGTTSMTERQALIERFSKDSDLRIFLLSTKAAGVGLTLTAANVVLLMDQDWNPHNDRQAEDRVHRIGQTRPVRIYKLCCQDTIEYKILKIAKEKLSLDQAFGGKADTDWLTILWEECFQSQHVSPAS